jgi:chloramphenicol-sensitive protein RarD
MSAGNRHGILAAIGAYLIWGLVPIFFKQLHGVPATEIIAHRVVWSVLFMAIVLASTQGFGAAWAVARNPRQLVRIALASALVLTNWLVFVYGVNEGRILETSLGYFILPLLSVGLGVTVLGERLRRLQWLAVALAAVGVSLESLRVGGLPWISLTLAGTFAIYGLLRKQLPLDAASGLFLETVCMAPFALLYLAWIQGHGNSHFGTTLNLDLLLLATGIITAIPLLLFAIGARRLPLNVMGFLQYIAPTLTFLLAVFVYGEPMSLVRATSFMLIWSGLALFSLDLLRQRS